MIIIGIILFLMCCGMFYLSCEIADLRNDLWDLHGRVTGQEYTGKSVGSGKCPVEQELDGRGLL